MAKGLTVKIDAADVTSVNISKYSDGYNYASISAKPGSSKESASCGCVPEAVTAGCGCGKEYINVSYEWQGNDVPDVVMDIMSFVQSEKASIDISIEEKAEEWASYSTEIAKAKKGVNPFAKKKDEEDMDEDKKGKKDKKGDKDKKEKKDKKK